MKYNLFQNIAIYPNLYYSRKNNGINKSLNIYNLFNIIDRINLEYTLKKVFFLGEPFLWDYLPQAVDFFQQKKIKPIITTTGLHFFKSFSYPTDIEINLRIYTDEAKTRNLIEENIQKFLQIPFIKICLIFSFKLNDTFEKLILVKKLAKKFNLKIKLKPNGLILKSCNLEAFQSIVNQTIHQSEKFNIKNKDNVLRLPLPSCINTPDNYSVVYFCEKCPVFKPTFYPDGKTLTFCERDMHTFDITKYNSFFTLEKDILNYNKKKAKEHKPFEACQICKIKKKCQRGCLN